MKGIMTIDGQRVPFDGEKNVLAVIRKAGIDIPTFCYYSELSVHGACRMCMVEDVKTGKLDASCSMEPRDGMEIRTNTAKLLKHRRMILELLLAAHDCSCTTCNKSGNCRLQELAQRFGVRHIRFPNNKPQYEKDYTSYAVFRDPNKCILCGDCVRVCEELQGQGILNFAFRGSELQVMPAFDKKLGETKCVGCGQCAAVCTTGAITVNDQIGTAWRALHDPKKRVVIQIAPAVRVALGEDFGIPAGVNIIDKLVPALKIMGADEVYDTNFGADMTTISEAEEFLQRLKVGGPFPMFTSCCPAWVRYLELNDPKYLRNISTCKSPMEMFAAVIRDKYAEKDAADGRTTYQIAIMPCTAKKMEAARPEFVHNGQPDVDLVLTTRELTDMIREAGIQLGEMELESPDLPFGLGSGAAAIYGVTGGVVIHPHGVTLSQYLGNAFALIDANGASGVRIQNYPGIATDPFGYAVVPYLTTYQENRLSVDTTQLPDNVDLEQTTQFVVPNRGAMVAARFNANIGYRVLVTVSDRNGKPLPFGALASNDETGQQSIVDEGGILYLSGISSKSQSWTVRWGNQADQQCQFAFSTPDSEPTTSVLQGTAQCH